MRDGLIATKGEVEGEMVVRWPGNGLLKEKTLHNGKDIFILSSRRMENSL